MRVTLLGHASALVEMGPGSSIRCLMDPVFQDPFEDSAVSCPRRSVALDQIPPVDLLVISHGHLDHFDIPSLAHIAKRSRKCDVLCPKDPPIVYALQRLGFTKIHAEDPLKSFEFEKYQLLTTPSQVSNVIEFGVIFKDASGSFWNQVDTFIPQAVIPGVLAQVGSIDLLFAMYASQNFKFFESKGSSFPYDVHERNLQNVMAIAPRLAVPGSAGFRFAAPGMDWCNPFLFPMSRERFIADLALVAPDISTCIANPGDVFEIRAGNVERHPGQSRIVKMLEDDTSKLAFDQTAPIPPLVDPNPEGVSTRQLEEGVDQCLDELVAFVRGAPDASDALLEEYRRLRVTYAIGVVFPEGAERNLRIAFDGSESRIERGTGTPIGDAGHRIVASALTAWRRYEKSYFYLRAFSRKWSVAYALAVKDGKAFVEREDVEDLLAYFLQRKAKGAELARKHWIDAQLARVVTS